MMTGDLIIGKCFCLRTAAPANVTAVAAPVCKDAAGDGFAHIRQVAGNAPQGTAGGIQPGIGIDQRFGIRMPGLGQKLGGITGFQNTTAVHHGHPVAELADDGQVMGNHQKCKPELFLKLLQLPHNLLLGQNV